MDIISPPYQLYPEVEPHASGLIDLDGQHKMYWEVSGNPRGFPVVFLHGGPGAGASPSHRRFFDPDHYRIIVFDQRGSGKSRPYACIEDNTTTDLIEDIEKLRELLGIKQWIVFGGSWGSTLALAYAIAHPQRVSALVLRGIFLARQQELDWLYGPSGAARLFPAEYARFMSILTEVERYRPLPAYYTKLTTGSTHSQLMAAREWDIWENSISQLLPSPLPDNEYDDLETNLEQRPEITNLLNIFSSFSNQDVSKIQEDFRNKGFKEFKESLAEILIESIYPLGQKINEYYNDKNYLDSILGEGKSRAAEIAELQINKVKHIIGMI